MTDYTVDWTKQSMTHTGYDKDQRGFNIIDWILDFKRELKKRYNIRVNTISCTQETWGEIIKAFTEWSLGEESVVTLDYIIIKFNEINELGVIYLSEIGETEMDVEGFQRDSELFMEWARDNL